MFLHKGSLWLGKLNTLSSDRYPKYDQAIVRNVLKRWDLSCD